MADKPRTDDRTKDDLMKIAQQKNIEGRSSMNRDELAAAVDKVETPTDRKAATARDETAGQRDAQEFVDAEAATVGDRADSEVDMWGYDKSADPTGPLGEHVPYRVAPEDVEAATPGPPAAMIDEIHSRFPDRNDPAIPGEPGTGNRIVGPGMKDLEERDAGTDASFGGTTTTAEGFHRDLLDDTTYTRPAGGQDTGSPGPVRSGDPGERVAQSAKVTGTTYQGVTEHIPPDHWSVTTGEDVRDRGPVRKGPLEGSIPITIKIDSGQRSARLARELAVQLSKAVQVIDATLDGITSHMHHRVLAVSVGEEPSRSEQQQDARQTSKARPKEAGKATK